MVSSFPLKHFSSCFILTASILMTLYGWKIPWGYSVKFHWLSTSRLFSWYILILDLSWSSPWNWPTQVVFNVSSPATWDTEFTGTDKSPTQCDRKYCSLVISRLELKQKQMQLITPQLTHTLHAIKQGHEVSSSFILPSGGLIPISLH